MLEVELTLEQLREKSAKLGFTITNKETAELMATGHFVVVAADKNTGKATQILQEFADELKPFAKQIL
jgi:acyl-CoA thioesterase FadM